MTHPRASSPAHTELVDRFLADTRHLRGHAALTRVHPGRLVRNPCGEPATCRHGCYGGIEEAAHVRRTGLLPGVGDPPIDRGAGFTPPARS